MDKRDWYFKQRVTQADLDEAYNWVEAADHRLASDNDILGIVDSFMVTQHAPTPDLTVDIDNGTAYGKAGELIDNPDATTNLRVDVDEYGSPTTVPTPGESRYLSIFARFVWRPADPKVDGAGLTVETRQYQDCELFVRQGTAAVSPTPPAYLDDAVLLADVILLEGQTTIQTADIDFSRREDWMRLAFGTPYQVTEWSAGTAHEALVDLFTKWNEHVSDIDWFHSGATITFSAAGQWFNAVDLTGAAPPVTNVNQALDAIMFDLAAAALEADPAGAGAALIGTHGFDSTNSYVQWGIGVIASVQEALEAIAQATDGHIAGGAPAHPSSAVTHPEATYLYPWFGHCTSVYGAITLIAAALQSVTGGSYGSTFISQEPITGSPEAFAPPAPGLVRRVSEAIVELFGHVNDRTERATEEMIPASWVMNAPQIRTRPHAITDEKWAARLLSSIGSSEPWIEAHGGLPYGTLVVAPPGTAIEQIADGYDFATGRPLLFGVSSDYAGFWVFDPTAYSDATPWAQHPMVATAIPHDCVQIGQYLYILGRKNTTGAQAYVWQIDVTTWVYGPDFGSASGVTLTNVDLDASSPLRDRIIAGNDGTEDVLVVISTAEPGNASPLTVIKTSDATFLSGRGTMTSSATVLPEGGAACCLNGKVFFGWRDTIGGASFIGVAELTALITPERYTGHDWHNEGVSGHVADICTDGMCVWVVTNEGKLIGTHMVPASDSGVADGDVWSIEGTVPAPAAAAGDKVHITFDGLRLWIEWPELTTNRHVAMAFDPDGIVMGSPAVALTGKLHYLSPPVPTGYSLPATDSGRMIVSGDALWGVMIEGDRYLWRVPQIGMRS